MTTLASICELIIDCEHKTAPTVENGYPLIRTPDIGIVRLHIEWASRVDEANRVWVDALLGDLDAIEDAGEQLTWAIGGIPMLWRLGIDAPCVAGRINGSPAGGTGPSANSRWMRLHSPCGGVRSRS